MIQQRFPVHTHGRETSMVTRRMLILSGAANLLPVILPHQALARPGDDPAGIITGIYTRAAQGKGDGGGNFVVGNKIARSKYLSKSLAALWARADSRTRKGEVGPIDFDPVTNSQDPDVKSFKVVAGKQEAEKATVAVTIEGHQGPRGKPADQTVRYDFVREDGQWKIDDIKGFADGRPWGVRGMLAASLKN
jgi:hypothetical protein